MDRDKGNVDETALRRATKDSCGVIIYYYFTLSLAAVDYGIGASRKGL